MAEIKTICCGAVICRSDTVRGAVIDAALNGISLAYADLRYTNLSSLNLGGVDLSHANLCGANLITTGLRYADLSDANLIFASLCDVDLTGADISGTHFLEGSCAENLIHITDKGIRDLGAII